MKGFKLTDVKKITETELNYGNQSDLSIKVRLTKAMITKKDVLSFLDEDSNHVVLGRYGVGVLGDVPENILGFEKGKHVFISNVKKCQKCYNCKNSDGKNCSDLQFAGEDYDGFLSDFYITDLDNVFLLPDGISDDDALFLGHSSLAMKAIDQLNIEKGEYVAVVGNDNLSIIISEMLAWYQAIPIYCSLNQEMLDISKKCGIFYNLSSSDNWQKEVNTITGGRMCNHVIYITDDYITPYKAISLSRFNGNVGILGSFSKNANVPINIAINKQLTISYIKTGLTNIETCINMLANNYIDFSKLLVIKEKYENVPKLFFELAEKVENEQEITECIIDMN